METPDAPQEQNEQNLLDEMSAIRKAQQEPAHNRLADFEKQEKVQNNMDKESPLFEPEQIYINDKEILSRQDFADAMVDAYGNQPQLYGFEVYEQEQQEAKPNAEPDKEDFGEDLER